MLGHTLTMISLKINYIRGGNPECTVCEEEWNKRLEGSRHAYINTILLDALFKVWKNEKQHCRHHWLQRRMK